MDNKAKRISSLNPNAAPFVPFSRSLTTNPPHSANPNPPLVECKKPQHVPEGKQESTELAAEYMLPDSISDFEGEMTEEQRVVENISTMYPEIPMDFVMEFARAHGYDFDLTVDMLEQFYVCQAESSHSHIDVGSDPPNSKPGSST
ncbi:CTC-interacting domain 5 [Carex rostrata]